VMEQYTPYPPHQTGTETIAGRVPTIGDSFHL
jgi:hypothetical protein